jgi:sugar phosphate isomerase/epimerase
MSVRELDVGVCSWSLQVSSLPELEGLLGEVGVGIVQLALGDANHATWDEGDDLIARARKASFEITGTMVGFPGEDYTSPATIKRTGGFGDPARRAERLKVFRWGVDRTAELGVELVTTHAGFIPEPSDPDRGPFLDCLGEAVDYAAAKKIVVALETGQETAELLRRTLDELEAPNLKVNFDPANMILYNKGNPIHAIEILAADIAHVHAKDARYPTSPGVWGEEVRLGDGAVGMKDFLAALIEVGYSGPLVIEREAGNQAARVEDIAHGVRLLKKLLAEL